VNDSSKAYAATLAEQFMTKKYTSGGIREYIIEMSHMATGLSLPNFGKHI